MEEFSFNYDIRTPTSGQPPNFLPFINQSSPSPATPNMQSGSVAPSNNINKKRKLQDIEEMEVYSPGNEENFQEMLNFLTNDNDSLPLLDFSSTPKNSNFSNQQVPFLSFIPNTPTPQDDGDSVIAQKLKLIADLIDRINAELDVIKLDQKNLTLPIQFNLFERLNKEQLQLHQNCEFGKEELKTILSSTILSPNFLTQWQNLLQELNLIHTKIQLYQEELQVLYSGNFIPKCFACLVIVKSPFPKSVKQHTKSTSIAVEDPTIVQLIYSPRSEIRPLSKVKAGLVFEDYQSKRGSFTILNDQQELDDSMIARFTDLRFPQGTRLKMVRLQFAVEIQFSTLSGAFSKCILETKEPSNPFVVMTNENQWDQSEGMLLKKDIFDGNVDSSWCMFANTLQFHYLRSTRQEPAEPRRPLSKFDFQYIKKNFFQEKEYLSQKDFDKFWLWFGKVLHRIRHQKPFLFLWLNGIVYGFIAKADVELLLQSQPVGTFIIRFSERKAGKVAIAFNKYNQQTRRVECVHFLFDQQDANNTKTLPDFLRSNDNFTHLIKLKTSFNCSNFDSFMEFIPKDAALREYYSKSTIDPVDGYIDESGL